MTIQITPNNPQYRIVEIFESLQGEGWNMKTLRLPCRTTAEHMSVEMYGRLKNAGVKVCSVKLWETPTSCAEYEGE